MKTLTTLALVAVLAAPAFAKPAAKVAAAKTLTDARRAKLAVAEVSRDFQPWVRKGTDLIVRPALVPFNGDKRNPITGAGPIKIFVTQKTPTKGFFGRVRQFFNPHHKETFLVNVDNNGQAQILDRMSLAPQRRVMRFFTNKLALGSLVSDFMKSGKLTETLFTAAGASGAAMVSPILSGALWMRVAQVVGQGISSQNAVRKKAFTQTVAWANAAGKTGNWPTLTETYREYQSNIGAAQSGASPITLCAFATQLSINRL